MRKVALYGPTVAILVAMIVGVLLWSGPKLGGSPKAAEPNRVVFHGIPQSEYVAAFATWASDGAASAPCVTRVYVTPAKGIQLFLERGDLVFEGECSSFSKAEGAQPSPAIKRREPGLLVFELPVDETTQKPATFRLRTLAGGGQVRIRFETKE